MCWIYGISKGKHPEPAITCIVDIYTDPKDQDTFQSLVSYAINEFAESVYIIE